jgi:hypothetical protein
MDKKHEQGLRVSMDWKPVALWTVALTAPLTATLIEAHDTCGHEHAVIACPKPVILPVDGPHNRHTPGPAFGGLTLTVESSVSDTGLGPLYIVK